MIFYASIGWYWSGKSLFSKKWTPLTGKPYIYNAPAMFLLQIIYFQRVFIFFLFHVGGVDIRCLGANTIETNPWPIAWYEKNIEILSY